MDRVGSLSHIEDTQDNRVKSFRQSKWQTFDPDFAEMIKSKYPSIWGLGGNIKGNDQFRKLYPITQRGGSANSESEINALQLREAWIARHFEDFRLPGIIAQIKWLAVGSKGEKYMKDLVREKIAKMEEAKHATTLSGAQEYLQHHGVKGMRWGVRKSGSDSGVKKYSGSRTRYKGKPKDLTDEELFKRIKRLEAEKRYSELNSRTTNAGKKHAGEVLTRIGKESAVKVGVNTAVYGYKKGIEKKFGQDVATEMFPKKK